MAPFLDPHLRCAIPLSRCLILVCWFKLASDPYAFSHPGCRQTNFLSICAAFRLRRFLPVQDSVLPGVRCWVVRVGNFSDPLPGSVKGPRNSGTLISGCKYSVSILNSYSIDDSVSFVLTCSPLTDLSATPETILFGGCRLATCCQW